VHLLVLIAQRHWTGAAEPTLQLAHGLAERGHRVTFVYTRRPPGHLTEHVNEQLLETLPRVSLIRKGYHPVAMPADAFRLRRFLKRERPEVLFCHLSHDHWLALAALRGLAAPPILVRQIHESRQLRNTFGYRLLYRRAEHLVVSARSWKQALVDRLGIDPSRVLVLPAGVDVERFTPAQLVEAIREEIGAAPEDRLIGLVGRIKPGRGQALALAAFPGILEREPRARLLFVGRGEGKAELEAQAAAAPFAARVHFLGYRAADLPAIYAALDVALLLGEGSDGACRAALEALACGTPVVARPVGALGESLKEGETGLFVENDPASLADGIVRVLAGDGWRERCRRQAVENLSLEKRLDRAEAFFERLAEIKRLSGK